MNSVPTMKFKLSIIVCLFVLTSQPVYAIKVSGLYQATATVSDESAAKRKPAIKRALLQVLIKLTGNRNIAKSSGISNLIERPEQYVQQFRYQQASSQDNGLEQSAIQELWVQFDESALNDVLRSYSISIWGKERPSILVWFAHEGGETRSLVTFEESPEYITMLDNGAAARGISLLFPLLDLEDTSKISVSDVWADFKEPVLAASTRYQSDVILTGKLIQVLPTLWETQWSVYIDASENRWTTQGESPEIVLEEGIDVLVDRLAHQYVNTGSTRTEVISLLVTDINNVDKYARALSYLESLHFVRAVQVKHVSENEVLFEVISDGGTSAINQTIALGKTLELVSNEEQLHYRLIR